MSDKLLDQIFNLKFTSKQMVRQSVRSEKEEKEEKLKVRGSERERESAWRGWRASARIGALCVVGARRPPLTGVRG